MRRVVAAGGRVEPKKLPTGRTVGEDRLWLQDIPTPGLLLSRCATCVSWAGHMSAVQFVGVLPYLRGYLWQIHLRTTCFGLATHLVSY